MNPNSMAWWWPRLEASPLSGSGALPSTVIVPIEPLEMLRFSEGYEVAEFPWEHVRQSMTSLGFPGRPVFVRADYTSAKHYGPSGYRVAHESDLLRALGNTAEAAVIKSIKAKKDATPRHFVLREWLDIQGVLTAFKGHRIGREWRVFASASEVVCMHPYWPKEALRFDPFEDKPPKGWEHLLEAQNRALSEKEEKQLGKMAMMATRALREGAEAWAVDFAMTKNGWWYLIDVAEAQYAWHPNDHKKAEVPA